MRNAFAAVLIVLALAPRATPSFAQVDYMGRYNIMRPEPGVPPKYKTPRGSTEHVVIPPSTEVPASLPQAAVAPSFVVPQTGQVVPNQPVLAPSGPNRTETYQDRAVRCATQAGNYGGDHTAFVGSCINQ
ncbi:MAG TPA: hypothetical protein VGF02_11845 [Pseudolabrys sp.]|jgi:hypothetical protein